MGNDAQGHWADKYRETFAQFIAEAWEHREQTGLTTVLLPITAKGPHHPTSVSWIDDGKPMGLTFGPSVSHVMVHLDRDMARFLGGQLAKIRADSKKTHADLCMSLLWPAARNCPICDKTS